MEFAGSNRKRLSCETSLATRSVERRLTLIPVEDLSTERTFIIVSSTLKKLTYTLAMYKITGKKKKIEVGFKPIVRFRVPLGR